MPDSKIYTSKAGLKFSIVKYNKPAEGNVVYFTESEWIYLKDQKLEPEQFALIWNLKKENHLYSPIDTPKTLDSVTQPSHIPKTGSQWAAEIVEMLRAKRQGRNNCE